MWCIYTEEYYSAIGKNVMLSFTTKWMGLENMMLSEISQSQKDEYHMSVSCGSNKKKVHLNVGCWLLNFGKGAMERWRAIG